MALLKPEMVGIATHLTDGENIHIIATTDEQYVLEMMMENFTPIAEINGLTVIALGDTSLIKDVLKKNDAVVSFTYEDYRYNLHLSTDSRNEIFVTTNETAKIVSISQPLVNIKQCINCKYFDRDQMDEDDFGECFGDELVYVQSNDDDTRLMVYKHHSCGQFEYMDEETK